MKSILTPMHNQSRTEYEFLPAVLEVEETPPLPIARIVLWSIIAFFVIAVIWSIIGRVDIVGVAPGKIVATGRTKSIQPLENAVVSAIHVHEGEHVNAGDVLIELDPTASNADSARLNHERMTLTLDRTRLLGLMDAVKAANKTGFDNLFNAFEDSVDAARLANETARATESYGEYRAALAGIAEEAREKRAERAAIAARITQLEATLPLISEEAQSYETLMASGMVPRVNWLNLERERIAQQQELAVQRNTLTATNAALDKLSQKEAVTAAQYRGRWMQDLAETENRLASYDEEIEKAERRVALRHLTAPVSGAVQQLAVHTVGGVVTEAQTLMLIVPDNAPLEVEAMVLNKDIGFIREGQNAAVKVETFNFTKYGYLAGRVNKISRDAIIDKERGLYYLAHVVLESTAINVNGEAVEVEPGMAVSVEVRMGQRRVIEFLLSPLLRYKQETWRER